MDILQTLQQALQNRVMENKDISYFLTIRTKTFAQYYFAAESREDIINAVAISKQLQIPYFILGGGSNLAILKDTMPGLVIHNRYIKKEVQSENGEYVYVLFSSGYPMSLVVKETIEMGLSGFEYHLGLPGTIGGAMYMNSKWTKPLAYCGDVLYNANILDRNGQVRQVIQEYFEFSYDYSILQKTGEIFLDGVFKLKKEEKKLLQAHAQSALQYRKETQPFGVATGGCFFQNISEEAKAKANLPTTSAGYLIDQAGLKGTTIGSFTVSDKHANFIINNGEGKPEDLKALLSLIKKTINDKYGVELEEEVRII